jgi:hypothetical protein
LQIQESSAKGCHQILACGCLTFAASMPDIFSLDVWHCEQYTAAKLTETH